jgi:RNA polymerase sporulation-specific sigma factor
MEKKMKGTTFGELTDEELIRISRDGDTAATDFLMEKYKNLVRQKARTLYLIGGDNDDLIQEGMIGLYKAIRDYSESREASFCSFAKLCITRQLYNAIKASRRQKNSPLNTYVSLYSPVTMGAEGDDNSPLLGETIRHTTFLDPEEILIDKENVDTIEYELGKRLSSFEQQVIDLYIDGNDYQRIAVQLDKSPKSIDNALQRIRTKLLAIIKDDYNS